MINNPQDLAASWLRRATLFRGHAHEPTARTYEACADDLEAALHHLADAVLTLREASSVSGLQP
jgi:hypothetical protein